jgi:hypothetical protein
MSSTGLFYKLMKEENLRYIILISTIFTDMKKGLLYSQAIRRPLFPFIHRRFETILLKKEVEIILLNF